MARTGSTPHDSEQEDADVDMDTRMEYEVSESHDGKNKTVDCGCEIPRKNTELPTLESHLNQFKSEFLGFTKSGFMSLLPDFLDIAEPELTFNRGFADLCLSSFSTKVDQISLGCLVRFTMSKLFPV